jgi:hypothetical protein
MKPTQKIDLDAAVTKLTEDTSLADVTTEFNELVDDLAPVPFQQTEAKLFSLCLAGLKVRRMLNPDDDELALDIAALALTRAVLAKRAAKCDEKAVSA